MRNGIPFDGNKGKKRARVSNLEDVTEEKRKMGKKQEATERDEKKIKKRDSRAMKAD